MEPGLGPMGEASGPVALVLVLRGSLWVWKVTCFQKVFQLARWIRVDSPICFRFLKANSVA